MTIATAKNCKVGTPVCWDCNWYLPPKFNDINRAPRGYCSRSAPKFDGKPVLVVIENYTAHNGKHCFGFSRRW